MYIPNIGYHINKLIFEGPSSPKSSELIMTLNNESQNSEEK